MELTKEPGNLKRKCKYEQLNSDPLKNFLFPGESSYKKHTGFGVCPTVLGTGISDLLGSEDKEPNKSPNFHLH